MVLAYELNLSGKRYIEQVGTDKDVYVIREKEKIPFNVAATSTDELD